MTSLPFSPKKTVAKKSRRGFSLVISLVMMALMLLISIALVSLVWLESQLTENKVKRYQAQANAICGLRIAMGQLQLLTGDDQRVTATADILGNGGSDNPSLPAGTPFDGKRHWTGVWATGGLDKSSGEKLRDWDIKKPDEKPFLGWLVSDYSETTGNYSPIEQIISKTAGSAEKGKELVKNATSPYSVADTSPELITLVGAGTLGKKEDWAESEKDGRWEESIVKVRRVPMEKRTEYQKAQKNSGSFAYWVGDEGVKARINLSDAYANVEGTEFSELTDWERGMRSTAQRVGVEILPAYKLFMDWWKKDITDAKVFSAANLPYVQTSNEMAAYSGDDFEDVYRKSRPFFHDVSFFSRGVLSDVYNGGLKTDLSVAFEMPWFDGEDGWDKGFRSYPQFHGSGEKNEMNLLGTFSISEDDTTKWWIKQPEDGLGFVYEFNTGVQSYWSTSNVEVYRGPTWDVFRNYYRLYKREVEKKGVRGFKPSSGKSWTATGMSPYSYVTGKHDASTSLMGFTGVFGQKANYARLSVRGNSMGAWGDTRLLLPTFDGKNGIIPQSMRLTPVVLRSLLRFSVVFNQDTAAIVFDPMLVIHNPYSVPLEFFGFGSFYTKFYPFALRLVRSDGANWPGTDSSTMNVRFTSFSGNSFGVTAHGLRLFAGTNNFNTAPKGSIKLLPGEIKAIFPNSATPPIDGQGYVASLGGFGYEEGSNAGFDIPFKFESATEADQSIQFTIDVGPSESNGETDMFQYYLFYPKGAQGQSYTNLESLKRSWQNTSSGDVVDGSDEQFIQGFDSMRIGLTQSWQVNYAGKTFTRTPESGYAGANKQFFLDFDVYKATGNDSPFAGPLLTNTRPWSIEARNWDWSLVQPNGTASNNFATGGVGWVSEIRPNSNSLCPITHVAIGRHDNQAYWGDAADADGQSCIVLYDVPQRPILSLGQLQSVDCTIMDFESSYVVGNSYPAMGVKDLTKIFEWPEGLKTKVQPRADHSYAANVMLFDRYFFSGINYGEEEEQADNIKQFGEMLIKGVKNPLPNKRVTFIRNRTSGKTNAEVISELQNPNKTARNFLYEGMFNINSTSVEAWKAQLASLNRQYIKADGAYTEIEKFPLVRFAMQIGEKLGGDGNVKDSGGNEGNGWRWYRSFDEKKIAELAEKIVEQVRFRGPFMSMADFVNRRIAADNAYAKSGALQAAIDEAKLNSSLGKSKSTPNKSMFPNLIPPSTEASAKAGAPGYLTQADILTSIGAGMAARSDTFTIRAYGDVFGLSGIPEARAYCEAVVQRLPDWVVEEEESILASDDNKTFDSLKVKNNYRSQNLGNNEFLFEKFEKNTRLKPANRLFGRRYKIVSFRWLSPDEV